MGFQPIELMFKEFRTQSTEGLQNNGVICVSPGPLYHFDNVTILTCFPAPYFLKVREVSMRFQQMKDCYRSLQVQISQIDILIQNEKSFSMPDH